MQADERAHDIVDADWFPRSLRPREGLIRMIAKSVREAEQDARRDALEEACKAVCPACSDGDVPVETTTGHWRHRVLSSSDPCRAIPIRRLMEGKTE